MKRLFAIALPAACVAVAAALLSGCARTAPSHFYILSAIPAETAGGKPAAEPGMTIGVGPVVFAEYLKRPQMTTRAGKHEISVNEFHRWAEPLEEGFGRVLAEDLAVLLPDCRIVRYPWASSVSCDRRIAVSVLDLMAEPKRQAVLNVRWAIYERSPGAPIAAGNAIFHAPLADGKFETVAASLSGLVEELARQLSADVREVPSATGGADAMASE